jgi:hypothetical protein
MLAPFDRVFGATGVIVGTGVLNAVAVGGAVLVGYRRGGMRLALLVALLEALLAHALGLGLLVDPWNPWVAFLPFVLFVLLVWCVLCDDFVMLPVAVAVGSFSLQTHAGYLPLVGGPLVIAVGWAAWRVIQARRDSVSPATAHTRLARAVTLASLARARNATRALGVSAIVALVVWSGPLVQQLTGDSGNLGDLISYARDPSGSPVGWTVAFGVMGAQVRFPGPWITGDDADVYGFARTASTIPALVLVAVLVACIWWTLRRGSHDGARLSVIALLVLGLGVVATARTTPGSLIPYVIRWWWVIPAVAALAVAWTAMTTCPAKLRKPAAAAVFVALIAMVTVDLAELPAPVPRAGTSEALAAVAEPTAEELDPERRYLVTGVDEVNLGGATSGLYVELHRRGFNVFAQPGKYAKNRYGSWRLARPDKVDDIVTIVNLAELGHPWEPPVGSRRVAFWDPLTFAQRARSRELEGSIRASLGELASAGRIGLESPLSRRMAVAHGARPHEVDELHDLQQLGAGYAVYVSPVRLRRHRLQLRASVGLAGRALTGSRKANPDTPVVATF